MWLQKDWREKGRKEGSKERDRGRQRKMEDGGGRRMDARKEGSKQAKKWREGGRDCFVPEWVWV